MRHSYRRIALLAEELGLDPGPELRQLEAAILAQDHSLDVPAGPAPAAPKQAELRPTIPRSLVEREGLSTAGARRRRRCRPLPRRAPLAAACDVLKGVRVRHGLRLRPDRSTGE